MTKTEKLEIIDMPPVGYWSALGGVEVKKIEHGFEDRCICVSNAWHSGSDAKGVHKLKIRYDYKKDDSFVIIFGKQLYFSECIRCDNQKGQADGVFRLLFNWFCSNKYCIDCF